MAKKVKIKNFEDVLDNIKRMFNEAPKEEKSLWCEILNEMLDNMRDEDFFGTEGQCDPRGDNRN
jgi:hypothetical protein